MWLLPLMLIALTFSCTFSESSLSTFRTENLRVSLPKACSDVFQEAFTIMKTYFLHRDDLTEDEWKQLKLAYTNYKDPHKAIISFMKTFGDRYSYFIPKSTLIEKSSCYRGDRVGLGVNIKRKIEFPDLMKKTRDAFKFLNDKIPIYT